MTSDIFKNQIFYLTSLIDGAEKLITMIFFYFELQGTDLVTNGVQS